MKNWKILSSSEYEEVWNFVYNKLCFEPYEAKEKKIILPQANRCFNIASYLKPDFKESLCDELYEVAQAWFKAISKGKRMYALNWKHEGYSFDPELPFEPGDVYDKWLVPAFPNGDYIFFLTHDFKNGIFGDGINFRISLWGKEIIEALEANCPEMLKENSL